MDTLILNQSLEIYGQPHVAICRLSDTTSEALKLLKKGWSNVVVLDLQDQPQGLFNARCLLNWQSDTESCVFAAPSITLEEVDLEPLPAISSAMSIADFLQRISQYRHSAETWALVNTNSKFVAILEVSGLLRSLTQLQQSQKPSPTSLLLPLIYQLPLPVMVSDQDGKVVGMNSAWRNNLYESLHSNSGNNNNRNEGSDKIFNGHSRDLEDSPQILQTKLPETQQFCTINGAPFTWQVVNVPLHGSLQGLELAIAYDITAQKNLAQELSGVSRLKDEFLTCINHELKTPLTSVIGIASLLSNNTFGELNERQSRYMKMIHQSGRQLVSIIDNIFDLAKAEAGQLELYAETISVKDVCQKSIQQVRKLVQQDSTIFRNHNFEEGWELDVQLDIDSTVQTIFADETRLQQMLVNLLSNAFKFSVLPSGMVEDLAPTAPRIGINVRWWEGWLALTVWDQGIGIPEEKQSLVFQKFQQVENVLTRRFEGTGSSLLLTRHIARLHGGDITFVSQVDVGSQFTILLPPEPLSPEHQTSRVDNNRNRLVLIVETSAETLEWLRNTLASLDYQVVIARTGTEALEKARRLQPCLILLSPHLPMLSGWDVLALLKGDAMTQHIRMVMMRRNDDSIINSHQADGILLKPIKTEDLNTFLPHNTNLAKPLKFLYLNQNINDSVVNLLQDLGHCLLEVDDFQQCDVLSKIWQPDLFLLDGDNQFLLTHLETISDFDILSSLPILLITRSAVAEIDWLQNRFPKLSLRDCMGLSLDNLDTDRADILLTLHQSITNAVCFVSSPE
ncbi:hybrid sensor histidine kinase/response regulator [Pseudanabaena sp. FACHB-1998]|uniref:ATP-binding response regulator n=1 Tax=Pseudanabaena sp. FACHB-1998 TaxID=2692858 RepID=UPI00168035C9|nr:hybrid sensor histidine kinase/response regulator [Pseudanabaena sp. FACHB-1998]MBD2175820.1 hybrid sensor histidine kinase/response regulator [Pseudanabaena sp. FACHB-1998]